MSVYVEPVPAAPETRSPAAANAGAPATAPSDPSAKAPLLVSHGAVAVLAAHAFSLRVRCGSAACKVRPNVWITIAGRSWQLPVTVTGTQEHAARLLVTVTGVARRGLQALFRAHPRWRAFVNVLLGEPSANAGEQLTSMGQLSVSRAGP